MKLTIGVVVVIVVVVSILVFIFTASYYKSKAKVLAHNEHINNNAAPWEKFTKKNKNIDTEPNNKQDATTAILKTGIESLGNKKGFFDTFKDVLNVTSKKLEEATRKEELREEKLESDIKDSKIKNKGKNNNISSKDDFDNNTDNESDNNAKKKPKTKSQRIWKRQERCREILEKIFNKKFPLCRPAWNINTVGCPELNIKPGRRLELDGYCEELKLGFEHQGKYHEVEGEAFSSDPIQFKYIKTKDQVKRDNCEDNNVTLLNIPDKDVVPFDELYEYITRDLEKRGFIEFEE